MEDDRTMNRWIGNITIEHYDQLIWRRHCSAAHIYRWVVAFHSLSLSLLFFYIQYIWLIKIFSPSTASRLVVIIDVSNRRRKWEERTLLKYVTCLILVALLWQVYVYAMLNRIWCMCSITHICKKSNKTQITKDRIDVRNHYAWSQ
jgi:hypothetical protein